jgi:amino acid transporter
LGISAGIAVLFIVFGQTFERVITILAFFFVANYTLSFISVFVLRRREPDKERPYRAWGYPWTTALALIGSILFLAGAIASDTRNSVYALLLLAVSYPVFRFVRSGEVFLECGDLSPLLGSRPVATVLELLQRPAASSRRENKAVTGHRTPKVAPHRRRARLELAAFPRFRFSRSCCFTALCFAGGVLFLRVVRYGLCALRRGYGGRLSRSNFPKRRRDKLLLRAARRR